MKVNVILSNKKSCKKFLWVASLGGILRHVFFFSQRTKVLSNKDSQLVPNITSAPCHSNVRKYVEYYYPCIGHMNFLQAWVHSNHGPLITTLFYFFLFPWYCNHFFFFFSFSVSKEMFIDIRPYAYKIDKKYRYMSVFLKWTWVEYHEEFMTWL